MAREHSGQANHSAPPYREALEKLLPSFAAADVILVVLGSNDAKSRVESVDSYFEQDLLGLLRYIFAQRNDYAMYLAAAPALNACRGRHIQPAQVHHQQLAAANTQCWADGAV